MEWIVQKEPQIVLIKSNNILNNLENSELNC